MITNSEIALELVRIERENPSNKNGNSDKDSCDLYIEYLKKVESTDNV
jgi:hypothetical protein